MIDVKRSLSQKCKALLRLELNKPETGQDIELIEELSDLIIELNGLKLPDKKTLNKNIYSLCISLYLRKRVTHAILIACIFVIITTFLLFSPFTYADNRSVLEKYGHRLIEIFEGESYVAEDKIISKSKDLHVFESIESFLQSFDKAVYYPTYLPDGIQIETAHSSLIDCLNVIYITNKPREYSFQIEFDYYLDPDNFAPNAVTQVNINGLECYILDVDVAFQGYFYHNNNTYTIVAPTYDDVYNIIKHMKLHMPKEAEVTE